MAKIIITLTEGAEVSHEFTEELVTIGRTSENVIHVNDVSVSSRHAQISFSDGHYILKDLDSTNGTRVNGHSFTEGPLHDGDRVRFGKVEAQFISENPEDARPLPELESVAAAVAENSAKPEDFTNASPFKSRSRKKDPVATAILVAAGVAVLVFIGAVVSIFQLQPPQ